MPLGDDLRRGLANPRLGWRALRARLRGTYYRVKFRLLGRRVIIGRRFQVLGPLDIRGPGTVVFGDNCSVAGTRLHPTTPYTHSRNAVIRFGNRVSLTSTRLGCTRCIEVGDDTGLSDARIMDSDFHALARRDTQRVNTSGRSKPVRIGSNVWIGAGAMVLKGVVIGENATVGAGAVVLQDVPPDSVVVGNPARVVWRLTRDEPPAADAIPTQRNPSSSMVAP